MTSCGPLPAPPQPGTPTQSGCWGGWGHCRVPAWCGLASRLLVAPGASRGPEVWPRGKQEGSSASPLPAGHPRRRHSWTCPQGRPRPHGRVGRIWSWWGHEAGPLPGQTCKGGHRPSLLALQCMSASEAGTLTNMWPVFTGEELGARTESQAGRLKREGLVYPAGRGSQGPGSRPRLQLPQVTGSQVMDLSSYHVHTPRFAFA